MYRLSSGGKIKFYIVQSMPICGPMEGVLPYMGYIGMCGPKGYGFSAVLVINRVWLLHSNLDVGIYLIIEKKINKSPSQIMFTVI